MKILIHGPAWVGDMVMAQVLFKLLKQQHPNAQIDVIAPPWSEPLLARMPEVNRTYTLPVAHGELNLHLRRDMAKKVRLKSYDQAIVMPNSFKSALIPWMAGIKKRTGWIGEWRYGLLNDYRVNKKPYPKMVEQFAALAFPKVTPLPKLPRPQLLISPKDVELALDTFQLNLEKPVLVLCPGAEFGPAKCWPPEHYAVVAQQKLTEGWQVWLMGSTKDQAQTALIQTLTGHRCVDLAGKTNLAQAIDLLSTASLVVSNDSGLMHIAAALSRKLVVIYGSTDPKFTPPLGAHVKILSLHLPCSPCFKRVCPLGHLNCLKNLTPDRVLSALHEPFTSLVTHKKILIVKTSSLGDVIHTLPAIHDALLNDPHLQIDWLIEESFADIARLHPGIHRVIPVAWRRWRKKLWSQATWREIRQWVHTLRSTQYDVVIDAQGLLKSAVMSRLARGYFRCGLSKTSAREPWASAFYHQEIEIKKGQHAIERTRQLFAHLFHYTYDTNLLNYGLGGHQPAADPYIILLHGTTWETKHWPEVYWTELAKRLVDEGMSIRLLWGNLIEQERAQRIAEISPRVQVCPKLTLKQAIEVIAKAQSIVAVDTGLAHLAAALNVPSIVLYGPTNAKLTGTLSPHHLHLSSTIKCAPCLKRTCQFNREQPIFPPCFTEITPSIVVNHLMKEFLCKSVSLS